MAERVRDVGGRERRARIEEDPRALDNPVLAFFLDNWRSARGQDPLPRHDGFDPKKVRGKLPWVTVIDALPGLGDFRYRVVGTQICKYFGNNSTGRTVREFFADIDPAVGETVIWIMKQACDKRIPVRLSGPAIVVSAIHCPAYDTLYMPYASDGERADRIVAAFVFDPIELTGVRGLSRMVGAET